MLDTAVRRNEALSLPVPADAKSPSEPPLLLQYWSIFLRWKWLIGIVLLTAVAVGLIVTLLMTPKFTATARIEISREQKNITNVQSL